MPIAVAGDDERTAVLWAPENAPSNVRRVSLGQLRRQCYAVAAGLHQLGHMPGARQGCRHFAAHSGTICQDRVWHVKKHTGA